MQTRRLFTSSSPFTAQRSICSAVLVASGLLVTGCVADDVDPEGVGGSGAGTAGMGGSGTSGGGGSSGATAGGGGSSGAPGGIMDNPEFGMKLPCVSPTQPLILNFAPPAPPAGDAGTDASVVAAPDATAPVPTIDAAFGNFSSEFSGGTYRYPGDGAWPVASDVSGGSWHLSGDVGTYSGFGLYFGGTIAPSTVACNVVDLSMYDGISFTISGNVGTLNTLTMSVAISANNASHLYLNTVAMPAPATPAAINSGRCVPPTANQFDGSCAAPSTMMSVTAEPTTVTMLWSDFTMGRPAAAVDPAEITGIAWAFPAPPGVGADTVMPYPIDLVIDDIQFVDNP